MSWFNPPTDSDPRTKPGAYVTDETHLYEVIANDNGCVQLRNCRTEYGMTLIVGALRTYRLVQAAPEPPDSPST